MGGAASSQRKETTDLLQDNVRHGVDPTQLASSRDGSGENLTCFVAESETEYCWKSVFLPEEAAAAMGIQR